MSEQSESLNSNPTTYRAYVLRVNSGDDFVLLVDLGFESLHKKVRARLHGVDCPDTFKHRNEPHSEAQSIRETIQERLKDSKLVTIRIISIGKRGTTWIVQLWYSVDGIQHCLNQELIELGYVYRGRK